MDRNGYAVDIRYVLTELTEACETIRASDWGCEKCPIAWKNCLDVDPFRDIANEVSVSKLVDMMEYACELTAEHDDEWDADLHRNEPDDYND